MGQLRSLIIRYHRRRFAILFFTLLLTLVGHPLLEALHADLDLGVFLALNLLAVTLGSAAEGRWGPPAVLAVLFIAARGINVGAELPVVLSASEAFFTGAAFLACAATLRSVFRRGVVDAERIYAALSVYLLAGLMFGVAYHAMESVWPGSLRLTSGEPTAASLGLMTSIYFSFVTLATLGYGDVVPLSSLARATAMLEAVGSQLYLAVLIARLVSLHGREE
jgi:ion channel